MPRTPLYVNVNCNLPQHLVLLWYPSFSFESSSFMIDLVPEFAQPSPLHPLVKPLHLHQPLHGECKFLLQQCGADRAA